VFGLQANKRNVTTIKLAMYSIVTPGV